MNRLKGEKNRTTARERVGVIFFESGLSTVPVVKANCAVRQCTTELWWSRHGFYTQGSSHNLG